MGILGLNTEVWKATGGRSSRVAASLPGLPRELLSTDAVIATELTATAKRGARDIGPLDVSADIAADEVAFLAVRHPSGALTFHLPTTSSGETAPRNPRFVVDDRSHATPVRTIGPAVELRVILIKAKKPKGGVRSMPRLAELFESDAWKKRGLEEGWRIVNPERLKADRFDAGTPTSRERSLLFIPGMLASAPDTFRALLVQDFFSAARQIYGGRIFAFEHFSVSRTPEENARMLLAALPAGTTTFDVITHGRGGLVLRHLVERAAAYGDLSARFVLNRAILVACPNSGTPVAMRGRLLHAAGWLANLLELFPENPLTFGAGFVASALVWSALDATDDIPGFHAMEAESESIRQLETATGRRLEQYSALVSNYWPTGDISQRVSDLVIDDVFASANDLFVPSGGGWELNGLRDVIPGDRIGCFGPGGNLTGDQVHHFNFFHAPGVGRFLIDALQGVAHPIRVINPTVALPEPSTARFSERSARKATTPEPSNEPSPVTSFITAQVALTPETFDDAAFTLPRLSKDAMALAEAVSIAARIEPELLRAMRLDLLPWASVSAEADVWFCDLMESRSPRFAVMHDVAARRLRSRLAENGARLAAAWPILDRVHRNAPPALHAEEELTWRVLTDPTDPEIRTLLDGIAAGLQQGRQGLARWAARALPRLPARIRDLPETWRVSIRAGVLLGSSSILNGEGPPTGFASLAPELVVDDLPLITVGVRLFANALQLSLPPAPDAIAIEAPDSNPVVLEVSWDLEDQTRARRLVSVPQSTVQLVEPVGGGPLRILTARLEEFEIQPVLTPHVTQPPAIARATASGLTVRVLRGDGSALLAFDLDRPLTKQLAGFTVVRVGPGGLRVTSINPLAPRNQEGSSLVQSFDCIDVPGAIGPLRYDVTAKYFGRGKSIEPGAHVSIETDLREPDQAPLQVGFTRDALSVPEQRPDRVVGARASELLDRLLRESLDDPSATLQVLAARVGSDAIVDRLCAFGVRLSISPGATRGDLQRPPLRDIAARLSAAGCLVNTPRERQVSRHQLIIQRRDGRPTAVLTGSHPLALTAGSEEAHHVVLIRNNQVARLCAEYADAWVGGARLPRFEWVRVQAQGDPALDVARLPGPDLVNRLAAAVKTANASLVFSLETGAAKPVLDEITRAARRRDLLVVGVLRGGSVDNLYWNGRIDRVPARRVVNRGSFVAVDFDRQGALVFAGSSGFIDSSKLKSGETVLGVHDSSIATAFAIEIFREISDRRIQQSAKSKQVAFASTDAWTRDFYRPQFPQAMRRVLLAGSTARENESQDGQTVRKHARAANTKTSSRRSSPKRVVSRKR
jgi:hypothetical protein